MAANDRSPFTGMPPEAETLWQLYGLPPSPHYGVYDSNVDLETCERRSSDGVFVCTLPDQTLYVRNVYPPIQELQPRVILVIVIFVLCFIVGVCGNSSILTLIKGVAQERRNRSYKRQGDNAILYIGSLAIGDFLMSLSLPPAILDSVIGFWMFGTSICKLHHICGSVGRILSTFLITAMSFDRFVAVCYPHQQSLRSNKFVISFIALLMSCAFLLLLPMLTYASAKEMVLHELKGHDVDNITRVRVFKCSDMMPSNVFYWFTTTTFIMGYMIPLILIVYFNTQLIRRLYMHKRVLPRSSIPLKRVVWYTIAIAVMYFVCWTPYWCSVLYAIYMTIFSDGDTQSGEWMLFLIYCVHLLPYLGSSTNWILYGMLNTQLQQKTENNNDEHMSVITTLNNNTQTIELKSRIPDPWQPVSSRSSRASTTCARNDTDSSALVVTNRCNGLYNGAYRSGSAMSVGRPDSETTLRLIAETEQIHL